MFGFIKDKLKKAVEVFTKATTEEKPVEEPPKQAPQKKEVPKKPEQKKEKKPEVKAPKKPEPKKVEAKPAPKPIEEEEFEEAEEEIEEEVIEEVVEQVAPQVETIPEPKKQGFFSKVFGKKEEPAKPVEKKPEPVQVQEPKKEVEKKTEEPTGFFGKLKAAVTTKQITRDEFETIFQELEMDLLENNVALEVVDKMKDDLWEGLSTERFSRFAPEKRVLAAFKESIEGLFMEPYDILAAAKEKDLYIICAVGINGSGKTTTLAKMAQYFKDNGLEPVLAAGDTFRAAAIQQLEEHANKIGVKIIKQQYGADAAAVAFDAIQYAKANKARVVLIDTAGRLHSNTNLMEELKKIVRVAKPDTTIFIGEATTGNDCVEQAVQFQQAVDIDGIVLSKVDVDERGGAALSISYVTKKPILFFGTGQTYKDLQPFKKEAIVEQLTSE
jgi:fused signal recognition particle receptor